MVATFSYGCNELAEVWSQALSPVTLNEILQLGPRAAEGANTSFHLADALWTRIIFEFEAAYKISRLSGGLLLRSLTPLYLARVASFVLETQDLNAGQFEDRIEQLCTSFEQNKATLRQLWNEAGKEKVRLPNDAPRDHPGALPEQERRSNPCLQHSK